MNKPFEPIKAQNQLYDVLALANAAKAMCGNNNDEVWRVIDVLVDRLQSVINRLEELDIRQQEEAEAALNSKQGGCHE